MEGLSGSVRAGLGVLSGCRRLSRLRAVALPALSDETKALARQCFDEALFLAGIADRSSAAFRRVVSAASDTMRPFQMALMRSSC
jgi:hypothetical protein